MFECYNNIVGFTSRECDCTSSGRPADYNESKSGLYIDDLAPIDRLVNLAPCDSDMWKILTAARGNAIKKLVADSNALLASKYSLKRQSAHNQFIGEIKSNELVNHEKSYSVVRIVCSPIRGGRMIIRNVGVLSEDPGDIQFKILNNLGDVVQALTNIESVVSNKYKTATIDLELPLYSKYVDQLEYYVMILDTWQLKATKVNCGCGNFTPSFNTDNPYYNAIGTHKNYEWADYVIVGGHQVDSESELDDLPNKTGNDMWGIGLEIDFSCKVNEVICEKTLDFQGNPLAMSLALAVNYLSAVNVGEAIIKSDLLNRANMLGIEEWEDSIVVWNEKYNEHINYIVSNVDHTANDCLTCKDFLQMTRQGLFA